MNETVNGRDQLSFIANIFNVNNLITAITRPRDENLRAEDNRRRKELVRGENNDNITARLRDSACL